MPDLAHAMVALRAARHSLVGCAPRGAEMRQIRADFVALVDRTIATCELAILAIDRADRDGADRLDHLLLGLAAEALRFAHVHGGRAPS